MALEIERKFLVDEAKLISVLDHGNSSWLEQFYLARDPWVRVRIIQGRDGPLTARLTIKGAGTLTRPEFEYEIPVSDARTMRSFGQNIITKTRFKVRHEGHLWEVDRFHGGLDGLWLAEIELKDEREAFVVPPWLSREVTEDVRFSNAYLVEHGIPHIPEHL